MYGVDFFVYNGYMKECNIMIKKRSYTHLFTPKKMSWEERKQFLSERDRVGYQREDGYWEGFGYISPFTDTMIHLWLDAKNIPKYKEVHEYQ
jgi:hypothetical protein